MSFVRNDFVSSDLRMPIKSGKLSRKNPVQLNKLIDLRLHEKVCIKYSDCI